MSGEICCAQNVREGDPARTACVSQRWRLAELFDTSPLSAEEG